MIIWKREGNKTIFYLKKRREDGKKEKIAVVSVDSSPETEDFFEEMDEGIVCWKRKIKMPSVRMVMEAEACFAAEHTLIPAVSYDGNPWGKDHEYKGYEKNGIPYTYAWHRTAVPGASASWNEEAGAALYGTGRCSGSLSFRGGKTVFRVLWPETEEPEVLYADTWEPAWYGTMEPTDEFTAYLCLGEGKEAVKRMLSYAWTQNYILQGSSMRNGQSGEEEESGRRQAVRRPEKNARTIWELSTQYARRLYTEEKDGFRGFSIGYTWNGTAWEKREKIKYEIGWCGQNASLAVSLLYDYQMTHNRESLDMGISVLDSWVEKARSENGFLLTRYDDKEFPIDACNLGTAGQQLLEASAQAEILGIDKKKWEKTALEICDFVLERQQLDGRIGMSWNHDGSARELLGSAGAFLILPLAEAFMRTGNREYHVAAVRAYSCYFREFMNHSYGTSGALDTCCIDKESVIPLLKAGILLYHTTGFTSYLNMAEEAAWYLSTWQWHQSVEFPEGSVLGKLKYDTFGGTAVSTSHHHMDPFALCYVTDLLELAELTGHMQWKERALAIWINGSQMISDGTLCVTPTGPRPAGSCDEGYIHTRWANSRAHEKDGKRTGWGGSFDVTQWLVAWPCAFRLETLRKSGNWNLLDGIAE